MSIITERQKRVNDAYEDLRRRGIITNKKELADRLNINYTTVVSAFKGVEKCLTAQFEAKLMRFYNDITGIQPQLSEEKEEKAEPSGIYIPKETLELFTNMSRAIDRLTRMVEAQAEPLKKAGEI